MIESVSEPRFAIICDSCGERTESATTELPEHWVRFGTIGGYGPAPWFFCASCARMRLSEAIARVS